MQNVQKKKLLRGTAAVLASMLIMNLGIPSNLGYANTVYDDSNDIYSEDTQDTYLYDLNDKVITTKTGVERTIPEETGLYNLSYYPIPLKNVVPNEEIFELIKAENKELMENVETDIQNGTLTKHIAADGQFYGTIAEDVLGVEKTIYVNTNSKGSHSLACYVPAGEIATVTLSEEALSYAKKGLIKISIGTTMTDADSYAYNSDTNNRMPYLGKTFSVTEQETQVGTPFGGMIFIEIDSSIPSGLQLEVQVTGVVDTPYYDLGQTTTEEWQEAINSAGLYVEIRTPYLRFLVPSYFIREIEDPYQACLFWTNAVTLSATVMALEDRTTPMTLLFDDYITAGVAYASVGAWSCNLPTSWAANALDYDSLMENGSWGLIHEINHHYQSRYSSYSDDWGLGDDFGEITNNVLNTISYILYTNIAAYRGEDGTDDWNKVADPYSSLKQQIYETSAYYDGVPNMGNFVYSTLAHELGPVTLANIIQSTYDGGVFNGIQVSAYDYKAESDGEKTREERYDDFAYRICVASERNYLWYLQDALSWPITQEMVEQIEELGFEEVIPVQSVYAMGEVGRETGRPYYVPSTGYIFDFDASLVSPGTATVVDISEPMYGTLTELEDGIYSYTPSSAMPEGEQDEFVLTILVEADGIARETQLNCTIGLLYDGVLVEHYAITKWDVYEALETLKVTEPYKTITSTGMKIYAEDGNNLAKTTGYFYVQESGEYTFQAFGDDCAVFELYQDDGTTLQSLTVESASTAEAAYSQSGATHFTVSLEANTVYTYNLIANNNGGSGWANVNIRNTDEDSSWETIEFVCSNVSDVGKVTDRSFVVSEPVYVRPSKLAASDTATVKGVSVISTPQGVSQNEDENSANEGDPNNLVDGDISTYFHSSYDDSNRTAFPHDYIFDLGSEQNFYQIELLYRQTGDDCGVIGDYEIYVADEYADDLTDWTLVTQDNSRQGNLSASEDVLITLEATTTRYVKVRVLNNRGTYNLSIIAEVVFSMNSTVNNIIAQNSSYIQYTGDWWKDTDGVYVNGATYNTNSGSFMYYFQGSETNLYVTKDTTVEVRIDGGEWKTVQLTGSLREPSLTLTMDVIGVHYVEVRAIGEEFALNMISTDGIFLMGETESLTNSLTIHGADNIVLPVSKVVSFDPLDGVSYTDELGISGLEIQVSGELGTPSPGSNMTYKLAYSVTDSYENTTSLIRLVKVTNQIPKIHGLSDVTIVEGEGRDFDYLEGVTATDYEDVTVQLSVVPTLDLSTLSAGEYTVDYEAEDSDGNVTVAQRMIYVTVKSVSSDTTDTETGAPDTGSGATDSESGASDTITPGETIDALENLTAKAMTTSRVGLAWSKVDQATGYKIYRYNASTKKYVLIKTITKNSKVSYTDRNLSIGTTYKYKVVAYYKDITGSESKISVSKITTSTKPATIKIIKITSTSNKVVVRWSEIKKASGYEIYRSTSKTGTYKKVTTIQSASTLKFTNRNLAQNKTYYYKVRAYKVVNGQKIYGAFSKKTSILV